jgi:hypothetical protein
VSASTPAESRSWFPDLFATFLVVAAQLLSVLNPELIPLDREELYNAAHGRFLQLGHLNAPQLLQYRAYCGGCTLNAALGAGVFTVLGPSLLAWKLVPIGYTAAAVLAGGRWLRLHVGRAASVALAMLFIFAPPTWLELSLIGWGNHMEAGCLAVVALALTARLCARPGRNTAVILGIVLAIAGWVGFPSGFIGLAVVGMLVFARRWSVMRWVALGCAPLLLIWALQTATTPTSPFETVYYEGERLPRMGRIPEKLASLTAPRQLVALFGHAGDRIGWWMGWAWAAGLAWAVGVSIRAKQHGARGALGFLVAFLIVYCLVRFTVWAPPAPHIASPGSMRYAAPIFPLAFVLVAAAIGRAWLQKRWVSVAIVSILVGLSGLRARVAGLSAPFPTSAAARTMGPDFVYFRDQASYLIDRSHHARCDERDPDIQAVHAFGAGWQEAQALYKLSDIVPPLTAPPNRPASAYFEGVGEYVRSQVDPRGQRGPELLNEMARRLRDQPAEGREAALREAAWRRSVDWMRLAREGQPHDTAALTRVVDMITPLRPAARRAGLSAMGRRWAHDVARWAVPAQIQLPAAPRPTAFITGLGEGLGELWGPAVDPVIWLDADEAEHEALREGYARGANRRWLSR